MAFIYRFLNNQLSAGLPPVAIEPPMISLESALAYILQRVVRLPARPVPIASAPGRVTARDITAPIDMPPFANSAMDGFAVRRRDLAGATAKNPRLLAVVGEARAGRQSKQQLGPGEAIGIATGAPIPPGADAVIPIEDVRETSRRGTTFIRVDAMPGRNQFVRPAGGVVRKGDPVIPAGRLLGAAETALLAAMGFAAVKVYPRPRVAVISTGDELQTLGAKPRPGKIFDCNRYSLSALLKKHGAEPILLGIAADNETALRKTLKKALADKCDFILTSGGVSMGRADLVKKILRQEGSEVKIMRVAVRPGKPLAFGKIGKTVVFGLPGNPVSAIVSFVNFVLPALMRAQGREEWRLPRAEAILAEDYNHPRERLHFARAAVTRRGKSYYARPERDQGSGNLLSLIRSNAFLILPIGKTPIKKGRRLAAIPFAGLL